ncbi:hypothetical protein EDEG_03777, partial [Edhazardia aedis USNM 41457]
MVKVKMKHIMISLILSVFLSTMLVFLGVYKISSNYSREYIIHVRNFWKNIANKIIDDNDRKLSEIFDESEKSYFCVNIKPVYEKGRLIVQIYRSNWPLEGTNYCKLRLDIKHELDDITDCHPLIEKRITNNMAAYILKQLESCIDMIGKGTSFFTKFYFFFNSSNDVYILRNALKKLKNDVKFLLKSEKATRTYFFNYIFNVENFYTRKVKRIEQAEFFNIKACLATLSEKAKHTSTACKDIQHISAKEIYIVLFGILIGIDIMP